MSEHPTVLVTGGAGYIGSHALLALKTSGACLVVLDDLSTGNLWAIPKDIPLVRGDGGGVRHGRDRACPGRCAQAADQSLWLLEADDRADAGGLQRSV